MDDVSEVSIRSGKGFKYLTDDVLHETGYQKISVQVVYIPNAKTGQAHHVDMILTKLSKTPKQEWSDAKVTKMSFTSDNPKSLQKLLAFIKAQPDLAKYKNADVEINSVLNISEDERAFVQKVLTSFDTSEKRGLLVQAKKEDVNNLYAAVKHAKNKKAAIELDRLLADESLEYELQKWIKENTWVFGVEYLNFLDIKKIGIHSESDFIVESLDGYADLIELKKCEFGLFKHDTSHDSYYPTAELSKVIGQSIKYLKVMEDARLILKDEDNLDVLKPRIKIVIGKSSTMQPKEKEALRLLNDSLHNIEIMTYDELRLRAVRLNEHYSRV
ncbi:MAG: Shedu anti-phage system protein SduA domain-containing protein [Candidatus Saccharibacteria bacterium]